MKKVIDKSLKMITTGDPAHFSGTVWLEEIIESPSPADINVYRVTFSPKARTAWHTHPKGQILLIERGVCIFQKEGEAAVELKSGENVYIPPDVRHWHGAAANSLMTHLAIQTVADGVDVNWLEQVTDREYNQTN